MLRKWRHSQHHQESKYPRETVSELDSSPQVGYRLTSFNLRYTTCNLVLKLDMRILKKIAETHASIINKFAERLPEKETAVYFVVHPFPAKFGKNSAACGGNIMGVENIKDDCILLQASLATDNLPRSAYFPTFKGCLDELEAFAQSMDK